MLPNKNNVEFRQIVRTSRPTRARNPPGRRRCWADFPATKETKRVHLLRRRVATTNVRLAQQVVRPAQKNANNSISNGMYRMPWCLFPVSRGRLTILILKERKKLVGTRSMTKSMVFTQFYSTRFRTLLNRWTLSVCFYPVVVVVGKTTMFRDRTFSTSWK